MGGPIFASDEYAYFVAGKFNHQLEALYQLDPGLQRLSNFLYFSVVHACISLFGEQFLAAYRIIHALEYLAVVWLVCHTVNPLVDRQRMLLGVLSCLLFPAHIYIYAVMPEVDLMLLAAILGFVLVRVYPRQSCRASIMAGAALGTAILLKPHALAMLLAAIAMLGLLWAAGVGPRRLLVVFGNGLFMLASVYATLIVLALVCTGKWSLDPSVALGLKFYGRFVENSTTQISVLDRLVSALYYLLGNLTVVALIFAPVLVWGVGHMLSRLRQRHSTTPEQTALAIFAIVMLASHLAMVAWFTAGAAAFNDGEAMRLHGRYLGVALIWLPPLYFLALAELSQRARAVTNFVLVVAVLLLMFVLVPKFKIFPWDNPLLMAFFNPQNWYQWSHGGAIPYLGMLLFVALIVGLGMSVYKPHWQSRILTAQLLVILGIGSLQNYAWLYSHLRGTQEASHSGRTLGLLLGDKQIGRGVLVTEERYGRASYLLFGLRNAPKVIVRQSGMTVSPQDVDGADWVVIDGNYQPQFEYNAELSFKQLRLMTLRATPGVAAITPHATESSLAGAANPATPKTAMIEGDVLNLGLAQAPNNGVLLTGFNQLEEWGAWTAGEKAEVLLPRMLTGHLRVTLFGWSLNENLNTPIRMKIGDQVQVLSFTNAGKDIVLDVNVAKPTDRLSFESSVFKPADSARTLGIAVVRINIERLRK